MRDPHLAQAGGYTSTWFAGSGDEGRMGTPFTGGSTTGLFCIEGLLSKSTIGNRMPMKAAPSARYPT